MSNNGLNIEKFKIVYISKSQIVYVENDIAKLRERKYYHSVEEIPKILERAVDGWNRGKWSTNFYVISKEKINIENIKVDLNFEKYSIEQEILRLERGIKKNKYDIKTKENDIQIAENKIKELKLRINDLSEKDEEE